jgi:YHYH protein/Secretion system C-terminal sorting domain
MASIQSHQESFMKFLPRIAMLLAATAVAHAQGPTITCWIQNTAGATGYDNIPSNVQQVRFSADWVYVSCTCIPSYDIGPWPGNPNQAVNQNFVFKITRAPRRNTGTLVETSLGHIGVWTNGVSIFNAKDARSYNNGNIWHQNAIVVEGPSFDTCLGHPAPNGEYHHHLNPRCLYDDRDSTRHSPIIGYAFDGYPIYGAYGYRNADGSGGVTRMRSGFRLRSITQRTTRPDGTELATAQYGPDVSGQYPLGYYVEDFEYAAGIGDLDEHNGRQCVTPEYPEGTYAYFVTLGADGEAAYPYTLGAHYYGTVPPGNTGPGSGHNVPGEQVSVYTPSGVAEKERAEWSVYPNPAANGVAVVTPDEDGPWRITLHDLLGRTVVELPGVSGSHGTMLPLAGVPSGVYVVTIESDRAAHSRSLVVAR